VAAGVLLSLGASAAVATEILVLGSFEGRWFYGYGRSFAALPVIVAAIAAAVAGAALRLPPPRSARAAWLQLALWIVLACGLQALIRTTSLFPLRDLFVSDAANSFYSVSRAHEPEDVLRQFNRIRLQSPLHVQSNMPGKLMLLYALGAISNQPEVLAALVVLVSNLGAVMMFLFVRELFDDPRVALWSAVLYLFVPARLLFFPLMNTVTPAAVLCCAWLLMRWLRTGGAWRAAALGAALYGLAFFEPLPLAIGLAFAALSIRAVARADISADRFILQSAVAAATVVAVSELVHLIFGFELVRAFRQIGGHAVAFNASEDRPYLIWIRTNQEELVFGMGVCQAVVACGAFVFALLRRQSRQDAIRDPLTMLTGGLLAVLITLDLLGINRGEVIRLWIFLACFLQIPVAWACAALNRSAALWLVLACGLLQTAIASFMIRFVVP
jgi:hypothetical protein